MPGNSLPIARRCRKMGCSSRSIGHSESRPNRCIGPVENGLHSRSGCLPCSLSPLIVIGWPHIACVQGRDVAAAAAVALAMFLMLAAAAPGAAGASGRNARGRGNARYVECAAGAHVMDEDEKCDSRRNDQSPKKGLIFIDVPENIFETFH